MIKEKKPIGALCLGKPSGMTVLEPRDEGLCCRRSGCLFYRGCSGEGVSIATVAVDSGVRKVPYVGSCRAADRTMKVGENLRSRNSFKNVRSSKNN